MIMAEKRIDVPIGGMSCASCVATIEEGVKDLAGVKEVNVNLATERATVEYLPTQATMSDLKHAIIESGYEVREVAEGKELREFAGESYVMEQGLVADLALVHAWKGDREGNLVYRKTARNFNPVMATAGKVTVAEVEHLVEPGEIDPDHIHTPGLFVQRIVHYPSYEKRIEQRTVRKRD
jgi:copper ion binding protein